jgi:hypothetical protein
MRKVIKNQSLNLIPELNLLVDHVNDLLPEIKENLARNLLKLLRFM